MARLSVYLDDDTLQRVRCAAKRDRVSASRRARQRLAEGLGTTWPRGYFDVIGSLSGNDLERPGQGTSAGDLPREAF